MSAIEFTALPGRSFSVQQYNVTSGAPIGSAISPVTDSVTPTRYRTSTPNTGVVYVVATATNLRVAGYANLDRPATSGFSELYDNLDEVNALYGPSVQPPPEVADTISAEAIAASAAGPASITVDGLTVTNRSIADQIAADRNDQVDAFNALVDSDPWMDYAPDLTVIDGVPGALNADGIHWSESGQALVYDEIKDTLGI